MPLPELEYFKFKIELDPGDLTSIDLGIRKNVSTTKVNVSNYEEDNLLLLRLYFPDYEDSRACSIPQEFHILSFILGIQFQNCITLGTSYKAIKSNDQDSWNSAPGGNLLRQNARVCLKIIEEQDKAPAANFKPKLIMRYRLEGSQNQIRPPGVSPDFERYVKDNDCSVEKHAKPRSKPAIPNGNSDSTCFQNLVLLIQLILSVLELSLDLIEKTMEVFMDDFYGLWGLFSLRALAHWKDVEAVSSLPRRMLRARLMRWICCSKNLILNIRGHKGAEKLAASSVQT
ncbi:hypothetical protein Tco_1069497 [Tanacetum coccineum]|uniref:Uncharacterized protein n=1 Tax=Tanacetum coccineum TaxID=301880 RepID=A0ABQ5HKM1_9ASTR